MTNNSIIQVKNLIKKYQKSEKNSVDDISFDVYEGEFFAFLGPNGAGKTTTISILTTTLNKTSGDIKIAGFDIEKQSKFIREKIGIIFQKPSLDLNLTAEENIRLHSSLYGLNTFKPFFSMMDKKYKDKVYHLSEIVGIKDDLFKEVKSFSGGMKRKLEIVRSLIHNPKVLFLDEPSTGLDPLSRNELWQYLKEVRDTEKTTIFLTTHYLEEAEESDRVCIINNGKIERLGTVNELKNDLISEEIIINSTEKDNLLAEIKNKKYNYRLNSTNKDIILFDNNLSSFNIIKSIETDLSKLEIIKPTLEQAYINLIKQNKTQLI